MFGFTENKVLEAYKTYTLNEVVDIIRVNNIRINWKIVQGSYDDGKSNHTLHYFYQNVKPDFKIVGTPSNVIYLLVNVQ